MKFLEKLYRSPLGYLMSMAAHQYAKLHQPFMVYGYKDSCVRKFHKYTRISSTAVLMNENNLSIADHVWIWHYAILDATAGLVIEEGCQIGAWVGIFTHGSQNSIRLLGRQYVNIPNTERKGYTRGPVKIGAYTFIGAGAIVLPGVTVGKGCLIGAGTLVTKDIPDHAIVAGFPGQVKGNTLDLDSKYLSDPEILGTYYDLSVLNVTSSEEKQDSLPQLAR
jgi:acetyltransferase-like isoleucine patch superfamily enzyme